MVNIGRGGSDDNSYNKEKKKDKNKDEISFEDYVHLLQSSDRYKCKSYQDRKREREGGRSFGFLLVDLAISNIVRQKKGSRSTGSASTSSKTLFITSSAHFTANAV